MEAAILRNIVQKLLVLPFLALGLISSCEHIVEDKTSNSKIGFKSPELILSAGASMQDVLQDIKQLYLTKYPQAILIWFIGFSTASN